MARTCPSRWLMPITGISQGIGQGLGGIQAHQKGHHQSGPLGGGDEIDIIQLDARIFERLLYNKVDALDMGTAGQFGDDSAELGMDLILRCDHIGAKGSPIFQNRRRRFVTGRFNSQNQHDTLRY